MKSSSETKKLPLPETSLENARRLRLEMTRAEQKLWRFLRNGGLLGHKFRRQMPVPPYIVDFCCVERRLVVELDGSQHADRTDYDQKRTAFLQSKGLKVLRFWNNDVLSQTTAVLEQIRIEVEGRSLTPAPLPEGEGTA
jgi:very-short-patch-repair endonuclease